MANKELLRIGYIDEDQDDIDTFYRIASTEFDVKDFKPTRRTRMRQILDWVRETEISALIVDYDLKERDSVKFYGNEIIDKLRQEFFDFPSFIITSFEEKAISGTSDSDLVFSKTISLRNKNGQELLKKRIRNKILTHREKLAVASKRYAALEKKKRTLSLKEESELLDLDSFIERSQGKKGHISKLLKTNQNYNKLGELVRKVERLTLEVAKKKK